MLPTGELLIINISQTDVQHTYRCRTYHQLTQEVIVSGNSGRIQLPGKMTQCDEQNILNCIMYIFYIHILPICICI